MKLVAATAPKFTLVAPVKPDPVTVTLLPTGPDAGSKDVIDGAGDGGRAATLKFVALLRFHPGS